MSAYSLYHLVSSSFWPIMVGYSAFSLLLSVVYWVKMKSLLILLLNFFLLLFLTMFWFRDMIRESFLSGKHLMCVQLGLQLGMLLFIFSEFMLFLSFFWSFFHSSLSFSINLGLIWPPQGVVSIPSFEVPLLNTFILLSSGVSVTYSHYLFFSDNYLSVHFLFMTLILGFYFTLLQLMEYLQSSFSISDSFFGSIFFTATGFHGMHVLFGSFFLLACFIRMISHNGNVLSFLSYELSIWYWHFVDVIWLFLFSFIYWWGGCLMYFKFRIYFFN